MVQHTPWRIFLALFFIFSLPACQKSPPPFECTDAIGCVTIAPEGPVKIGVLQTLNGEMAPFGIEQARSIELALSKKNAQLFGHPIEVIQGNSRCVAEGGVNAALKMVADPQIVAILGPTCSGAAVTASEIMSEHGLTMISGTNGAPSLTSIAGKRGTDWQQGYFRTTCSGGMLGRTAASFAFTKLGLIKAAVINDGDAFTQGLTEEFKQLFTELGGEIVVDATVDKGDSDMFPVLSFVEASGADVLFFSAFQPEADLIVRQVKKMPGLSHLTLIGGAALRVNGFIEAVKKDGIGLYLVDEVLPEEILHGELARDYYARYNEQPQSVNFGYGYDAANLLFHALESVAIQEDDGTLHIGRQALRDVLYAIDNFEGVTKSLSCDEFGDCGCRNAIFDIVRLDDPAAGLDGLLSNVVFTYYGKASEH